MTFNTAKSIHLNFWLHHKPTHVQGRCSAHYLEVTGLGAAISAYCFILQAQHSHPTSTPTPNNLPNAGIKKLGTLEYHVFLKHKLFYYWDFLRLLFLQTVKAPFFSSKMFTYQTREQHGYFKELNKNTEMMRIRRMEG